MYCLYEDAFDGYGYERGEYRITRIYWDENEQRIEIENEDSNWDMENNVNYKYQIKKDNIKIFSSRCI